MSISKLLPTPQQFKFLKQRFKDFEEQGFPNCDPNMVEILQFFNRHSGVAPIFSCEGHIYGPQLRPNDFFIQFGLTLEGLDFIADFSDKLFSLIGGEAAIKDNFTKASIGEDAKDPMQFFPMKDREKQEKIDELFSEVYDHPYSLRLSINCNSYRESFDKEFQYIPKTILLAKIVTYKDHKIIHRAIRKVIRSYGYNIGNTIKPVKRLVAQKA